MHELELIKAVLDTYGIPLTILLVVGVLHVRLQISAHKDRLECSTEIKALNERIDQLHKDAEVTIQQIRLGHDSDMNALLLMQSEARREWKDGSERERQEWKQSISEITERLMKYLEKNNV